MSDSGPAPAAAAGRHASAVAAFPSAGSIHPAPAAAAAVAAAAVAGAPEGCSFSGDSRSSRLRRMFASFQRAAPSPRRAVHPVDHDSLATTSAAPSRPLHHAPKQQGTEDCRTGSASSAGDRDTEDVDEEEGGAGGIDADEIDLLYRTDGTVGRGGKLETIRGETGHADDGSNRVAEGSFSNRGAASTTSKEQQQQVIAARAEVYERYGQWFEELRGTSALTLWFAVAVVLNAALPAALLGAQKGQNIQPESSEAKAMNLALLCVKGAYAVLLTCLWPYRSWIVLAVETVSSWLETIVCGCLVGLQWSSNSHQSLQDAMVVCEVLLLGIQVAAMSLMVVLPSVLGVCEAWRTMRKHKQCKRLAAAEAASATGEGVVLALHESKTSKHDSRADK